MMTVINATQRRATVFAGRGPVAKHTRKLARRIAILALHLLCVLCDSRGVCVCVTERDRERQRETERDRERQRETERDRERQRETERDRERQRETERDRERQRETGKEKKTCFRDDCNLDRERQS